MQTFLLVSTVDMRYLLLSSCKWHILCISFSISIPHWLVSIESYIYIPFIFPQISGVKCLSIRLYVFLFFYSAVVSFFFDYLYVLYKINISTLLAVSYGILVTLIIYFSIFMFSVAILGPSLLQFTAMNLDIISNFFIKSVACICFPKLKTLS